METLKSYINESQDYIRYEIEVRLIENNIKYLIISDNFNDHKLYMFISPEGMIATRDSYEFDNLFAIRKGFKLNGKMITPDDFGYQIGNNMKNDHAMDCGSVGKKLYKKFEEGKNYKISTGNNPHGNNFKIYKA